MTAESGALEGGEPVRAGAARAMCRVEEIAGFREALDRLAVDVATLTSELDAARLDAARAVKERDTHAAEVRRLLAENRAFTVDVRRLRAEHLTEREGWLRRVEATGRAYRRALERLHVSPELLARLGPVLNEELSRELYPPELSAWEPGSEDIEGTG